MKFDIIRMSVILLSCVSHKQIVFGNNEEDSWIEPDAFARESYLQNGNTYNEEIAPITSSPRCTVLELEGGQHSENGIALMYFKKFVSHLFNNDELQYNMATAEYHRALLFTLLPEQLVRLQQLNDPRDLDAVLTEILLRSRKPTKYDMDGSGNFGKGMGILALIWDILKDLAQLLKKSEVQFLLGVVLVAAVGFYLHRRFGIGFITLIVAGVALFGYLHTYLECNRKLEAEHLLEIMLAQNKEGSQSTSNWFSPILKFFSVNEPQKQSEQDYIRKSSKLNLPFCRPDHVFILYTNDLLLTQLQSLIDKCVTTMASLKGNLPFPLNFLAPIALVALMAYIIKLTFKYILSPRVWVGVFQARKSSIQGRSLPLTGTAHHDDRVSGENLKLLLNAISRASHKAETSSATSGVQELLEPLPEASVGTTSTSNTATAAIKDSTESSTTDKSLNDEHQSENNSTCVQQSTENKATLAPKTEQKNEAT